MISMRALVCCVTLLVLLNDIVCPPVTDRPKKSPQDEQEEGGDDMADNLEYNRYLREVVNVLESDESFRQKLEASNISEIKSGEIAKHLNFVSHGIRTQLDELKRREIDRLNQVVRLKTHLQNGLRRKNPDVALPPVNKDNLMGHLDHGNPGSFEIEDLSKLIRKASSDLEEMDEKRRTEFKQYEMEKEYMRQKELEKLDAQKKAEAERKFKEQQQKHAEHPKLLHPGNEAQLKEVWEDSDGLNKKDFDPRTFFNMHDTNSDGFLDEAEVEALFQNELDKVYDPNAPEDDMMERYEEMNRMREHVMNEVDTNKDRLISLEEFLQSTKTKEFKKDESWETLDKKTAFSDEEFLEFERQKAKAQEAEQKLKVQAQNKDHFGDVPINRGGVNVMQQQQLDLRQQQQLKLQQQKELQQQRDQQQQQAGHDEQKELPKPAVAQPAVAQPNVAQPAVAQQAAQPPAVAQPAVGQPAVAQPAVAQPAVAQPAVAQPAVAQSVVQQPAAVQPPVV